MWTKPEVARLIDHAVLQPSTTTAEVEAHAALCVRLGVGCLCVRPTDVATAARALAGTACIPASVVGFPHGNSRAGVKALEASLAIEDGARELDMVMNVGRFLSGDTDLVRREIEAVVHAARAGQTPVKVILEICYLTLEQVAGACLLAQAAGADFVKTSTGFAAGGATPAAVAVMVRTVGATLGVKASGGIRTWADAVRYLDLGCRRLGTGAAEAVLAGAVAEGAY